MSELMQRTRRFLDAVKAEEAERERLEALRRAEAIASERDEGGAEGERRPGSTRRPLLIRGVPLSAPVLRTLDGSPIYWRILHQCCSLKTTSRTEPYVMSCPLGLHAI